MKDIPVGLKAVARLIVVALLPFVPVVLMAMPLEEIIGDLAKLLL
jgi:hypothetical protein